MALWGGTLKALQRSQKHRIELELLLHPRLKIPFMQILLDVFGGSNYTNKILRHQNSLYSIMLQWWIAFAAFVFLIFCSITTRLWIPFLSLIAMKIYIQSYWFSGLWSVICSCTRLSCHGEAVMMKVWEAGMLQTVFPSSFLG